MATRKKATRKKAVKQRTPKSQVMSAHMVLMNVACKSGYDTRVKLQELTIQPTRKGAFDLFGGCGEGLYGVLPEGLKAIREGIDKALESMEKG